MKTILFLLLFFICSLLQAQTKEFYLIDEVTQKPIILFAVHHQNSVYYSDLNGKVEIPKYKDEEKLLLESLDYGTIYESISSIKDTLFVTPIDNEPSTVLEEIVIEKREHIEIPQKRKPKGMADFPIKKQTELLSKVVFDKKWKGKNLNQIIVTKAKTKAHNKNDKIYKKLKPFMKVNIYDEHLNQMFASQPMLFEMPKEQKFEVIIDEIITLSEKPIYIGIELIGVYNEKGSIDKEDKSLLRIGFTDQISEYYQIETYLRFINDKDLNSIKKNNTNPFFNQEIRYLNFGFIIN